MLNSCKSSNQCQDHCVTKQVCTLHLPNANYLTHLHNSALCRNNSNKTLSLDPFSIADSKTKSYQKGKMFQVETPLFHIFDRICLISLSVFQVL